MVAFYYKLKLFTSDDLASCTFFALSVLMYSEYLKEFFLSLTLLFPLAVGFGSTHSLCLWNLRHMVIFRNREEILFHFHIFTHWWSSLWTFFSTSWKGCSIDTYSWICLLDKCLSHYFFSWLFFFFVLSLLFLKLPWVWEKKDEKWKKKRSAMATSLSPCYA